MRSEARTVANSSVSVGSSVDERGFLPDQFQSLSIDREGELTTRPRTTDVLCARASLTRHIVAGWLFKWTNYSKQLIKDNDRAKREARASAATERIVAI